MGHTVDIGYMRKYLNATANHRRWLDDQLKPYRERHREMVLEAEERYRIKMNAPLNAPKYPNTNYWDKWGPVLNGHIYAMREQAAQSVLEQEVAEADAQFERDTEAIRAMFNSRVKQAISGATGGRGK